MPDCIFKCYHQTLPPNYRLAYESGLMTDYHKPDDIAPNRFEQWLMQPRVLKEWFDRANRWRPEATCLHAIDWSVPEGFYPSAQARVRWSRVPFEAFKTCIVTATRSYTNSHDVSDILQLPIVEYAMELYTDKEGIDQALRLEGRQRVDIHEDDDQEENNVYTFAGSNVGYRYRETDPIWISQLQPNMRCIRWMNEAFHENLIFVLEEEMGIIGASDIPPVPMVRKARYWWERLWKLVRTQAVLSHWKASTYAPDGAGAKRARTSFDASVRASEGGGDGGVGAE